MKTIVKKNIKPYPAPKTAVRGYIYNSHGKLVGAVDFGHLLMMGRNFAQASEVTTVRNI